MSELLSVENLTMKFGGLTAIDDLSFANSLLFIVFASLKGEIPAEYKLSSA